MNSTTQAQAAVKLKNDAILANDFVSSIANYITYSAEGLEGMINSVYGGPDPSSMLSLYENSPEYRECLPQWTSQLGQDALVASLVDMKKGGFFIEIGCGNGTIISNTYSLETFLNWKGLLIEPSPVYCEDMRRTRNSIVVESAVTAEADQRQLTLISGNVYGSCKGEAQEGPHAEFLNACKILNLCQAVKAIEPKALCREYNVPKSFEYLSLDIEGGELGIILAWPFSEHRPLLLSIEHNYGPDRMAIRRHLTNLGYSVFGIDFDDFFVANELLELTPSYNYLTRESKMNSHPDPSSTSNSNGTPCYKSRLLATNWALRDQFLREIDRLKDDSHKMISSANQRIASIEDSIELIAVQAREHTPPYKVQTKINSLVARVFNKIKKLIDNMHT